MADRKPKPEPEPDTLTPEERARVDALELQRRTDQAVWDATHDKDGNPVPIR
jgi:hypothetical protein